MTDIMYPLNFKALSTLATIVAESPFSVTVATIVASVDRA